MQFGAAIAVLKSFSNCYRGLTPRVRHFKTEVLRVLSLFEHGVPVAQVALAWLLHQPQVTSVIIGAKRPEQLTENLAATQVALSDSELAALDEVSRLPAEYPGWMFERQGEYRRKQLLEARR